jgi:hypothetical protein
MEVCQEQRTVCLCAWVVMALDVVVFDTGWVHHLPGVEHGNDTRDRWHVRKIRGKVAESTTDYKAALRAIMALHYDLCQLS